MQNRQFCDQTVRYGGCNPRIYCQTLSADNKWPSQWLWAGETFRAHIVVI